MRPWELVAKRWNPLAGFLVYIRGAERTAPQTLGADPGEQHMGIQRRGLVSSRGERIGAAAKVDVLQRGEGHPCQRRIVNGSPST
jgi:hypothetical protein